MEPFSKGLFACAVTAGLYQMSGTPFLLNIVIFCSCTLLCLYAMFISGYLMPSEALFDWFYGSREKCNKNKTPDLYDNENDPCKMDDQITKRLRELTGHIVRDFILSWYNTVSDDVTFVQEAFELFEHLLQGSRTRVSAVERDKLLSNILSELLKHYLEYRNAIKEAGGGPAQIVDADSANRKEQLIVVAYCKAHGHPSMESLPDSEMEHLRGLVVLLLKGLLPRDYKLHGTPLYLVRELIAQNVLNSLVNLVSDPIWIYNTIVKILSDDEENNEGGEENSAEYNLQSEEEDCESDALQADDGSVFLINDNEASVGDFVFKETNLSRPSSAASENLTRSQTSTSSFNSQTSTNSFEIDAPQTVSSAADGDLPLPMMSSQSHFAAEDDQPVYSDLLSQQQTNAFSKITRPAPQRLFLRIRIPDSNTMQENFEGGGKYTLYRITYKTIKEPTSISQPCTSEGEVVTDMSSRNETESKNQVRVVKNQVQRRFREFLALQERLSQNMVARNLIADIKGPSRMFPVPFGNMDKNYIETRRKFLQAYLRELCTIPFISNSTEMREFLAYEMDPRIAYVRKPDSLPRFDKIVKSAIQDLLFGTTAMKFSSTLQLDDDDEFVENEHLQNLRRRMKMESNNSEEGPTKSGAVARLKNMVLGSSNKAQKQDLVNAERQFSPFEQGQRNSVPSHWLEEDAVILQAPQTPVTPGMRFLFRTRGDGCDDLTPPPEGSRFTTDCNVDGDVVAVLFQLMLHVWDVKPGIHNLVVLSFSEFVKRYLSEKVDDLTTTSSWTKYLTVLRDALWPGGKWGSDEERPRPSSEHAKVDAMLHAQKVLEDALPEALKHLVGPNEYENGVRRLLESLQNTTINRHLFYHLLDRIIRELLPDVDEVIARDNVTIEAVYAM